MAMKEKAEAAISRVHCFCCSAGVSMRRKLMLFILSQASRLEYQTVSSAVEMSTQNRPSNLPLSGQKGTATATAAAYFRRFDIVQSSYHFYADCIDLHICDEPNSDTSNVYSYVWYISRKLAHNDRSLILDLFFK